MPLCLPEFTTEQRGVIKGLTGVLSAEREPIGEENDVLIWRTGILPSRLILCKIITFGEVWDDDEYEPFCFVRPFANVALENPAGSGQFLRFKRDWSAAIDPEYWTDHLDMFDRIFFIRADYGMDCLSTDDADVISLRRYDEPFMRFSGSMAMSLVDRLGLDMDTVDFKGDDINYLTLS